VVTVIAMAALGVGLIFLLAVVVGVTDAMRAATWRQVAAQRRLDWEARQQPADHRPALSVAGR
jgi:hypothetical protein